MRFHYPNLDRPRKAAKRISRLLGDRMPLSKVQNGLSVSIGYRDWHELELAHAVGHPAPFDQALPREEFLSRSAGMTLKLAHALGIAAGEALYALIKSRLTGDIGTAEDSFAIRMLCWKATGDWPTSGGRDDGPLPRKFRRPPASCHADGRLRPRSRFSCADHHGQPLRDLRAGGDLHSTRSVAAILAAPAPLRLRRLDGAGRQHGPVLARLRSALAPARWTAAAAGPTDWIKYAAETWFWEDSTAPWEDRRRVAEEEARLMSFGITGLPLLVDLLPLMVASVGNVQMPGRVLEGLRQRENRTLT